MSVFQREFKDIMESLGSISDDIIKLKVALQDSYTAITGPGGISLAHLDGYDDIAGEAGRLEHAMHTLKSEYEVAVEKLSLIHKKLSDLGLEKKSSPPVVLGQLLESRWKMGAFGIVTSCEGGVDELYREVFKIGVVHKPISGNSLTFWYSNDDTWMITQRHCSVEEALTHEHPFVRQLGLLLKAQREFDEVYQLKGK